MSFPLDVDDIIDEFDVGPLTVERRGTSIQNQFGGYDVSTPPEQIVLSPVAAHNLTGTDLDQVPEADRNSEIVQFYTKVRLFVADGGHVADVVEYLSERYRIVKVQNFDPQGKVFISFGALEDAQAVP